LPASQSRRKDRTLRQRNVSPHTRSFHYVIHDFAVVCVKFCKLAIMVVTELNEAGQAASQYFESGLRWMLAINLLIILLTHKAVHPVQKQLFFNGLQKLRVAE